MIRGYRLNSYPTYVLIDGDGIIRARSGDIPLADLQRLLKI